MAAGFLLDLALNEAQNICTFPGFCQRVRYRKSNCQRCLEICPENAISLDPGPTLNNSCTECGLCYNACPSEVFQHEIWTDAFLLNQAKTYRYQNRHSPPGEKKTLWVHCHRAENQNENCLALTCLGRLTANIILGTAFLGFDEVVLTKGICSQCRFHQGEKLLAQAMMTSRILLESIGLVRFAIRIMEKEAKREALLSRREIFSKLSHKVKNKAVALVHHREKAVREKLTGSRASKAGKRPSPQRELLAKLLNQQGFDQAVQVKYKPEFPWGKIKIEEKKCAACGICVALCPTGAISEKLKNKLRLLCFNSSLCTNCSLCKAACPQKAIEFEDHFFLSDIVGDSASVVAAINLTSCRICGEMIAAATNKLCPTCRKRQVWPMYVQV
jgi:ferredoxin